jgi:hypothetical protein
VIRLREEAPSQRLAGYLRAAAGLCGAPDTATAAAKQVTVTTQRSEAGDLVAASPASSSTAISPSMTNADVIAMASAGLSDLVIANSIRQSESRLFDLTPRGLVALKNAKVSDSLIVLMQSAPSVAVVPPAPTIPTPPKYDASLTRKYESERAAAAVADTGCTGIELMGIYQNDMRPVSPLIMHFAKVRNGTSVTRIVNIEWLDYYGQEMTAHAEVGAGQIANMQLSAQSPSDRAPTGLKLASCR